MADMSLWKCPSCGKVISYPSGECSYEYVRHHIADDHQNVHPDAEAADLIAQSQLVTCFLCPEEGQERQTGDDPFNAQCGHLHRAHQWGVDGLLKLHKQVSSEGTLFVTREGAVVAQTPYRYP